MIDINILYNLLLNENIASFENELFKLIPELKYEKDFDQKSEWHCFDVWHHTLATIEACDMVAEDRLIMLLHDIGKPFSCQEDGRVRHFKGHAKKSAEIAKKVLDRFNINENTKIEILKIIEFHSTRINSEDINLINVDYYKRLFKIQMCDAKGYEAEHSKKAIASFDDIKIKLKRFN